MSVNPTLIRIFFDVVDSNINEDPNKKNMPRMDPETKHGLVTGECIKRHLRQTILERHGGKPGYGRLYIDNSASLQAKDEQAVREATGMSKSEFSEACKKDNSLRTLVSKHIAKTYFDVRFFGGVHARLLARQNGPVQVDVGCTVDPIHLVDRVKPKYKHPEILEKASVTKYGLYAVSCSVDNIAATKTGFAQEDLDVLLDAILHMFDSEKTQRRVKATVRKVVAFEQDASFDVPEWKLEGCVKATLNAGVEAPEKFEDYTITVDTAALPETVKVTTLA